MRLYKLDISSDINDNIEVDFNSLVAEPAHMKKAFLFDKEVAKLKFNDEERIVMGVMIAADLPIVRFDELGEYHVIFDKDVIKKIREKYNKKGYQNNLNLNHNGKMVVQDAFMLDNFLVDEAKGINVPKLFEGQDIKDGSWIASYKIENEQVWNDLKEGKYSGFSVEGIFEMVKVNFNKTNMNLKDKIMAIFSEFEKPEEEEKKTYEKQATLEDGTVVFYDGELAVGTEILVEVDGVMTQAPAGTHITTDGIAIVVDEAGKVTEIIEPTAEEAMTREEVAEAMSAMAQKLTEKFETMLAEKQSEIETLKADFAAFKNEPINQPTKSKFKTVKEIINNK